jgi:hypothetical protein
MTCAKLVGSLSVDVRDKVSLPPSIAPPLLPSSLIVLQMVKAFNEDPEISVLLVSLKAGGVALNLTAANYIFVMDPWWNPGPCPPSACSLSLS